MSAPRTLVIDIETSPHLAYVWDLWRQNVSLNQLHSVTEVMCFAAKWVGTPRTLFFSQYKHGREHMVEAAHKLFDEADAIVTYNGKKFDVPHLNREFILAGLTPPSPYVHLDLYQTVRKQFRFASNKLDHVSRSLEIGQKVGHEGFDLWKACIAGDKAAWARMERYNRGDVELTEELYLRLLPWMNNLPNRQLFDAPEGCPTCGGDNLTKQGLARTKVTVFQQWKCGDCGGWFRTGKREAAADLRSI